MKKSRILSLKRLTSNTLHDYCIQSTDVSRYHTFLSAVSLDCLLLHSEGLTRYFLTNHTSYCKCIESNMLVIIFSWCRRSLTKKVHKKFKVSFNWTDLCIFFTFLTFYLLCCILVAFRWTTLNKPHIIKSKKDFETIVYGYCQCKEIVFSTTCFFKFALFASCIGIAPNSQ